MLTYWFPAPVSFWWPLVFTVIFATVGVIAVYAALARRAEEPDAGTIALLYGIGFGLIALSEFMMDLDIAFGVSLAAAFAMSMGVVTFFAVAAVAGSRRCCSHSVSGRAHLSSDASCQLADEVRCVNGEGWQSRLGLPAPCVCSRQLSEGGKHVSHYALRALFEGDQELRAPVDDGTCRSRPHL